MKMAGWNKDLIGRSGCIFSMGVLYENAREAIIINQPDAISCLSELRAPSSERAERQYLKRGEENGQFSVFVHDRKKNDLI